MIEITPVISLSESELKFTFIRSPGPGGQNVNKVASAVQLRFDVRNSTSLPDEIKDRLITQMKTRITIEGELIIKATRYRTQERNKQDAIERLKAMIIHAVAVPKKRKKTKPSLASQERRLKEKKMHGRSKALRGKKIED